MLFRSDGVDMVFAECGNPDSIADRIEWMLNHRNELNTIAGNGYVTARQLLDFRVSMKHIMMALA